MYSCWWRRTAHADCGTHSGCPSCGLFITHLALWVEYMYLCGLFVSITIIPITCSLTCIIRCWQVLVAKQVEMLCCSHHNLTLYMYMYIGIHMGIHMGMHIHTSVSCSCIYTDWLAMSPGDTRSCAYAHTGTWWLVPMGIQLQVQEWQCMRA